MYSPRFGTRVFLCADHKSLRSLVDKLDDNISVQALLTFEELRSRLGLKGRAYYSSSEGVVLTKALRENSNYVSKYVSSN